MATTPDAVALTRDMIRFNTVNPPGNERPLAEMLGRLLDDAGFAVAYHEFAPTRASLIARAGSGDSPPLCLTGHIDTVPLGARPWAMDPFAGEVKDGRLYGRGSSDMKSGVAAIVAAAIGLMPALGRSPGVVLVITAGEETGCEGAYHLAGLGKVLGKAGAVVVGEPTSNYPFVGHKGALWLKARTQGVTAHGSMPERGVNAVYGAAKAISKLEDFDFNVARHQVLGGPTLNVGTVQGGMNINSVPDRAEIGIDIRTIPGQDHGRLKDGLGGYLGGDVEIETLVDVDGVWTDPDHAWMRQVFEIMAPLLGETPQTRTATYFTDASALTPAYGGPPTVILGPGEAAMAHQTDEYCEVARIEQAVAAYAGIVRAWTGI